MNRFFLAASLFCFTAQASRQIALTFDDAPRHDTAKLAGSARATKLLSTLSALKVEEVAFFINTERLTGEGKERMLRYAKAGHWLGNHTHSHPSANDLDSAQFMAEVTQADKLLRSLPQFWPAFRFPFLREGSVQETRDTIRGELKALGYLNAYITVNNYDWEMDRLLQAGIRSGKKPDLGALKNLYVSILRDCIEYYDAMAQRWLGRSPKHILLLHENDLAALFVGDLIHSLRQSGWEIISPKEAYQDPIANYQTSTLFSANPGRIGEIAKDNGQTSGLWHESCDENYISQRFSKDKIFP